MTTAMFIVIFARSKWWIDLNGKAKGPFLSRESAEPGMLGRAAALVNH